ncbi:uncharacterized protein LOC122396402 [Colletes gigas]|uniref:uncharacterized protein LOC122396402 n=1 Tax=Colletes gigas TaxID=935657 RepID=UPI001C9B2138|nr:uncharacterized protein LOC122396402 [Colletes gigas]
MSIRTVPNILKNNAKVHRTSGATTVEKKKTLINTKQNAQTMINSTTMLNNSSLIKKCHKRKVKSKRLSGRRKQEHFLKEMYNFPNWDIYSLIDDRKEVLSKNLFTSTEVEPPMQQETIKMFIDTQHIKQEIPVSESEQETNLLSPVSYNIPKEFIPESYTFSDPQKNEPNDLQNPIDFSSNEIFSKFNYESYETNSLDYLTEYTLSSDETHHSSSEIYDNDIYEKKHDINGNEVDMYETKYSSLIQDKENDNDVLVNHSLMSSKHWSNDISVFSDKKLNCSSDLYCGCSLENYALHEMTINEVKNEIFTETLNEPLVTMNNNTDSKINFNDLNSYSTFNEEILSQNPIGSTTLPLTGFINFFNEIKKEKTEIPSTVKQKCITFNDSNDTSFSEPDFNILSCNSAEEVRHYSTDILSTVNNKEFKCSLCSLIFSTTRAMAMHLAAAHGGINHP